MSVNNWHSLQLATQRLEERFPVESWRIDGVRIWPLVKADMSTETYRAWRQAESRAETRAPKLTERFPLRPAVEMLRTRAKRRAARRNDGASDAKLAPADALFYSDGASFVKIDGKFYERICDPLIELVRAQGRSAALVTPLTEFHHPRHTPSYFVQPRLDVGRLEARLLNIARRDRRAAMDLPEWEPALAALRAEVPTVRIGDPARYAKLVTYLEVYARVFGAVLDRVRPKVVFIVCYYALEPMALIRAARARGIRTLDLQHGSVNESHHAYAGRHRFPAEGFDLLPHGLWLWSEQEVATVRRWTNGHPSAPEPHLGGNPFLEAWRDEKTPFVAAATRRVAAIKARAPGVRHVAYALQGIESPPQIARLNDAIQRSRGRLFWWMRMHPAQLGTQEEVAAAFGGSEGENHLVQAHTEVPLYGVLRHMDAVATYSSSTVSEAAAFGVPSVLTSSDEKAMYQPEIEAGWTTVADPAVDLVAAIEEQIAAAPRLRARMPPPEASPAAALLERLFTR